MRLIDKSLSESARSSPETLAEAGYRLFSDFELRVQQQHSVKQMQDFWLGKYLLLDARQRAMPNRSAYHSSRPQSIVDTARRVLTHNPLRYRVASTHFAGDAQDSDWRSNLSALENVYHGMQFDLDRQLTDRGEMRARHQVGFHGLVRGGWSYRLQLSSQGETSTKSPLHYQQLDPRLVYPRSDLIGQESHVYATTTNLAALHALYFEQIDPIVKMMVNKQAWGGSTAKVDYGFMYAPLQYLEFSSREESGIMVDLAGLPGRVGEDFKKTPRAHQRFVWLTRPYDHGFGRSIIRYGNVNGVPATAGTVANAQALTQSPMFAKRETDSQGNVVTHTPNFIVPNGAGGWASLQQHTDPMVALAGRSILAGVGQLSEEYNDFIALLKDAVIREVRGTWVFSSPTGQAATISLGNGDINFLTSRDRLEKVDPHLAAPDIVSILQIISQEISDGSIDLRFILASEHEGSALGRARMEQASILQLSDYKQGVQDWAVDVAQTFNAQYARSNKAFAKWKMIARTPSDMTRYFVVDVDGAIETMFGKDGLEPVLIEANVKAALPVDMMARINMAKSAIDPSNPIMSLAEALDIIMETDDVEATMAMIWDDIGNRNPTIQLFRLAEQFKENGAPEIAQMIMADGFRQAFTNAMAASQGQTATPGGASPGILPGTLPPEATTGGAIEPINQGQAPIAAG